MKLKKKSQAGNSLIQDWTDFNSSMLHSISSEYFAKKGIDAFDNSRASESIPNSVTNSYPHALSLARILKANIADKPLNTKVKVLECGSGSGMFARHFLIAAQELGFLDRLEFYLSDIAVLSLLQIKEKGILKEFSEGVNFHFITLSLPDFGSARDLSGELINLEKLDLVIANYVIDALPMLPLKKKQNGKFDKLQLRLSDEQSLEEVNLVYDTNFLSRLEIKERWVEYDLQSASDLERKYFNIFESSSGSYPIGSEIRYSYFALAVIESLKTKLDSRGLFYVIDIPSKVEVNHQNYIVYANSIVNLLNENLLADFARSQGSEVLANKDHLFVRLLITNSPDRNPNLEEAFINEFKRNNHMNLYHELIQLINIIKSPQSIDVLKFLVDKFQEIDGKSALSLTSQGFYCEAIQDYEQALALYTEAQYIDFFNECLLDMKISRLRSILRPVSSFQII
jgi:hypothetical protein